MDATEDTSVVKERAAALEVPLPLAPEPDAVLVPVPEPLGEVAVEDGVKDAD